MKRTSTDSLVTGPVRAADIPDPLDLPFDQYQRYRLIARVAERLRCGGERLRVLDVGGRTGALARFLPRDELVVVDVERGPSRALVLGSGDALPLRSASFDLVVSADTLEHVPGARRDAFVREACRVARRWVVLAGPYQDARVDEAEELLAGFVAEKLHMTHRYLAEHRALGLPDRARVERLCADAGARSVRSYGHGDLRRWLGLMCVGLLLNEGAGLTLSARRMHRFYNEQLFEADVSRDVYRHAVVAAFDERSLPRLGDLFNEEGTDPDAGPTLAALALDFDRERLAALAERAGFSEELARFRVQRKEFELVRAELEARAAHEVGVVAAQQVGLTDLRAELARTCLDARALEAELRAAQAAAEACNERLVAADRELGRLRRIVSGRLESLKNALWPDRRRHRTA